MKRLSPVRMPARRALARQANDAACRSKRNKARDTELDGFFQQPIHLVSARDALSQNNAVRRLMLDIVKCADRHACVPLAEFDERRFIVAAAPVEQLDDVPRLQTQDLDMSDDFRRQREEFARSERGIDEEAWHKARVGSDSSDRLCAAFARAAWAQSNSSCARTVPGRTKSAGWSAAP